MARPRLSYANVASTLALVMALGGVSYAATELPKNSVGTKQLKDNAVVSRKIANGGVRTQDVANGAIGSAKITNGGVLTADVANGAIGSAKIADGSVTLKDLTGTDFTGTYNIASVAGNTCTTQVLSVPGARVGQFPALAFVGDVALPRDLVITAIKVSGVGSIRVKVCNPTNGATLAANGVEIRFITLA
jgi:hypothetical protein